MENLGGGPSLVKRPALQDSSKILNLFTGSCLLVIAMAGPEKISKKSLVVSKGKI